MALLTSRDLLKDMSHTTPGPPPDRGFMLSIGRRMLCAGRQVGSFEDGTPPYDGVCLP